MADDREIQSLLVDKKKAKLKNNPKEVAEICNYLGNKLSERGQLEEALIQHEEELKICSKLKDNAGCALAHRCIGQVFAEQGEWTRALKHQQTYLDISMALKDVVEVQRAWATLGRTYLLKEDLKSAEDAFRTGLKLVDKVAGKVKQAEWEEMRCRLFLNLGLIHDQRNQVNEGCRYFAQAIQIATKNNLKDTLHLCQNSLAQFYQKRRQYPQAIKLISAAIETVKSVKKKVFECEYLITKGQFFLAMKKYKEAARTFKKAATSKSPVQEDISKAEDKFEKANDLCKVDRLREKVESCQRESTSQHESSNDTDRYLSILEKMGDLLADLECYPTALDFYLKELEVAEKTKKGPHVISPILVSLAQTLADDGRWEEAINYFRKELDLRVDQPSEAVRTTLKIIEMTINLEKSTQDIKNMYESALIEYSSDKKCLKKILMDYHAFLLNDLDVDRASELEEELKKLDYLDEEDDVDNDLEAITQRLPMIDLTGLSSPSSSSESEEDEELSTKTLPGTNGRRPKRKQAKKLKTNEMGETFLHRACIEGDEKKVRRLLDTSHPVNPRDNCGWLPIHEAANHDFPQIVKMLIEAGAHLNDPGGEGCEGTTPLHDACNNGHFEVIRVLVEEGADMCLFDAHGLTPVECLRAWRKRVQYLTDRDIETFNEMVSLLEDKMSEKGFDIEIARKSLPLLITPSTSPKRVRPNLRRVLDISSPSPKKVHPASSYKQTSEPDLDNPSVARKEYQNVIKSFRRNHHQPRLDNDLKRDAALIDEDDHLDADDWLIDDVGKAGTKRRRNELYESKNLPVARGKTSYISRADSTSRQDNRTFFREKDDSNTVIPLSEDSSTPSTIIRPVEIGADPSVVDIKRPLIKVRIEKRTFLIKVPDNQRRVSWLIEETSERFFQMEKKKPVMYLETSDGAIICPDDLIVDVILDNEVNAQIQSYDIMSLDVVYRENCRLQSVTPIHDVEEALKQAEVSTIVNLSHCSLTSMSSLRKSFQIICESLTSSTDKITSIDMSFSDFDHPTLFNMLSRLRRLEILKLQGCNMTGRDVQQLSYLDLPICVIDLSYNFLGDAAYELSTLIEKLTRLRTIFLLSTNLSTSSLLQLTSSVSNHYSLQEVFLDRDIITSQEDGESNHLPDSLGRKVRRQNWQHLTLLGMEFKDGTSK